MTTTTAPPPPDVLAAFGLGGADVDVVAETERATTWRVDGGSDVVALRRSDVPPEVVAAVAGHLEHLVAAGVGVPRPCRTVDDELVVIHAGGAWSATAWIEGDPVQASDTAAAEAVGAVLASAHAVGVPGDFPSRPELPSLLDVADAPRVDGWSLRSGMVRLGQPLPHRTAPLADLLRRAQMHLDRVRREVEAHPVVAHGDVRAGNVVRRPDGGVVLLDWELARVDGRAADLAVATRGWPEGAGALVDGYRSVAEPTDEELAALPLLAAAKGLDHLATRVCTWAADRRGTPIGTVAAELDAELPDLTERLADFPDERSGRPSRGRGRGT